MERLIRRKGNDQNTSHLAMRTKKEVKGQAARKETSLFIGFSVRPKGVRIDIDLPASTHSLTCSTDRPTDMQKILEKQTGQPTS